jgi:hypothetical protein
MKSCLFSDNIILLDTVTNDRGKMYYVLVAEDSTRDTAIQLCRSRGTSLITVPVPFAGYGPELGFINEAVFDNLGLR